MAIYCGVKPIGIDVVQRKSAIGFKLNLSVPVVRRRLRNRQQDRAHPGRRLGCAFGQNQATRWTHNNARPNMGIGGITPAQKLKIAA
jgi:hypothetical protein